MVEVVLGFAVIVGMVAALFAFFVVGDFVQNHEWAGLACVVLIFTGLAGMMGYTLIDGGDPPLWTVIVIGAGIVPMLSAAMGDY